MAELIHPEKLQPSLLDRLTDEEPRKTKESRERRAISLRELRASVLRDLSWLLNTANFEQSGNLQGSPEVATSVLNFGIPDITGRTSSSLVTSHIERAVREAIQKFEPRLIPESVKVQVMLDGEEMNPNALQMRIEGLLYAAPIPIELYLKTDFDLETGTVVVTDQSSRR